MLLSQSHLKIAQWIIAGTVILSSILYIACYQNYFKRLENGNKYGATDLIVFYVAGGSITHKYDITPTELYQQPIIRPLIQSINPGSGTHFLYLPPAAVLFAPLALLPLRWLIPLWLLMNGILLISLYYFIIYYLLKDKQIFKLRYSLLLAALMISIPVTSLLQTGQINIIIAWLLMLMLYGLICKKPWLTGITLALATILKVFPGIFLLYILLKKQYKASLIAIGTSMLLIISSLPFFGIQGWMQFLTERLPDILSGAIGSGYKSISLFGSWRAGINNGHYEWTGMLPKELYALESLPFMLLMLSALSLVGWIIYQWRKQLHLHSYLLDYSLLIALILGFSRISHKQYVLWLIPFILYLLHWPTTKRFVPVFVVAIFCIITMFWDRVIGLPYLLGGFIKPVTLGIMVAFISNAVMRTAWFQKYVPITYEDH